MGWWMGQCRERHDEQSSKGKQVNKVDMVQIINNIFQKGDPVVRNRISVDNGFWKDCEKFFSEKYCDEITVGRK